MNNRKNCNWLNFKTSQWYQINLFRIGKRRFYPADGGAYRTDGDGYRGRRRWKTTETNNDGDNASHK